MNKRRRIAISNILLNSKSLLEDLLQEEEDALDNTPDSFCDSDRYHDMEDAIEFLHDAISQIEGLYDLWSER